MLLLDQGTAPHATVRVLIPIQAYNHWLINYLRDRPMRLLAYWLGACH